MVWKRFKGKKVVRGQANYDKATWIAEGAVEGQRYKISLPKETVKTAEQARQSEDLIRAKIRGGDFLAMRDKTAFTDFCDRVYLPYAQEKNANYKTKVFECDHLKNFFKNTLLKNITPQMCEKYKSWRKIQHKICQKCRHALSHDCRPAQISPSSVNRELTTLSALLTRAAFLGKIKDNPMRFVEKMKEPEPRERFLTANEKKRLLVETSKHYHLHLFVLTALLTGWRRNQIFSLKTIDLDAETQTVRLTQSKQQKRRRVPVSLAVWQIFERLAKETICEYLFYNRRTKTRYLNLNRKWDEALDLAGLTDFHFHDLRRCFASDMLKNQASDLVIQSALGHSKIDTTAIYARSENEFLRDALNKVSAGLNSGDYTFSSPSENQEEIKEISDSAN